ncbi:CaiB/BaiF CoA-transferase family protein [Phaeobacter gallaeciensis]|uniref:CaiB/BaiF CoA transferase family protein n=1 Tax=Phaeobacter gallaeciensis TaxID=60890 RepID=UPI00237F72DF|nr:CaiB/BaiF CoA-transferase family protein [Phaeobacter gallaeciensis]MDE4303767.1 CaiB/BaiF CoA-transferase family protein [Phaeobacter gallaeciensis]MDE4308826.1 CaiB/BaiF CoA-transferase family protein [Phaeobacter gallaeciensis]MDE4313620.1 CaiB/BaiF CoA-transferase family protein [Phaeobacter gallaeciensis]MDE4317755.1 CaiB/BaiF CoA-transferase family protein [Phaeobacter gallaeciensis]MDE4322218.1 CaiB/BaiF CoA-transferase family protein [Phaeobacter gallaeciensis]
MSRPLEGLKVVAIEQAVAAPFCTARLADAGAEVIKIERPEGDFARGYDDVAKGQSSYFVWLNRGKTSVTLNLAAPEGKAALERLLSEADVLIQNLKTGALERLGFGPDRLAEDFPRLITCSISGYGEAGPMAERKAYDLLIQAESGLCSITGGPSDPSRVGISIVDIATGATAYSAVLEAVLRRYKTGKGARISLSMFDVMADWLTVPLLNHEGGKPPKRIGMAHPSIAPYGVFTASDGAQILLSIQSDREWKKLCIDFLDQPDLADDPRFATNVARVANRDQTDALVARGFARRTGAEAIEALRVADVALASVNDMEGLSNHPHLRRISVETPNGVVSYPAPAPIWHGETPHYGPVPALRPQET